ncbi:MAG: GNAT family N-acetyltransferase [Phycisphaeraceae bacterium]|nr:GNAT family N-acetyltransferase [Phycisphaeraceae bacterium]
MIRIQRITVQSPLYPGAVALRESVLLGPIGYDHARFCREYGGVDERAEHFVAVLDQPGLAQGPSAGPAGQRVVGCLLLLADAAPADDGCRQAKVMQMAVDPQRQGEGLGRRLVVAAEARAFGELGLDRLYCHAQDRAVGFYEALGWRAEGEPFTEAGIGHRKMVLRAPPQPTGEAVAARDELYDDEGL